MRRIGWAGWLLAIGVSSGFPILASADDDPEARRPAAGDVDRVLGEWRRRMSLVRPMDPKFRLSRNSEGRGHEKSAGPVVLASPHRDGTRFRRVFDGLVR